MDSIRKKIGLQFIVSNGSIAAYFVLSVILARLLSPSEIGIYSITAVFVGFTHVFRDFGVVSFIKRQKTLTPEVLRAAIGVLLTSSWVIAGLLYLSSGILAEFFKQPGIKEIMPVLALGFVFIPFGSIPLAVLIRDVEVKKTTLITAVATTVYIVACITLAMLKFSYMSMAWANLASIVTSGALLTWMMPKSMPFLPSFKGWKKVVQFGMGAILTSSAKALDTAFPDIILGKLAGAHIVGIFSRANSTVNILNTVTGPTVDYFALPYFAKTHHDGHELTDAVVRTIAYLTGIVWPALAVTAVVAQDLISVLYGNAWIESASVIPWLCLAGSVQIMFAIVQPAMTAMGRPYLSALPVTTVLLAKLAITFLIFDGTLVSFGQALAVSECLAVPINLLIIKKHIGIRAADWGRSIRHSAGIGIAMLLLAAVLQQVFQGLPSAFLRLAIIAVIVTPAWLLIVFLLKHPLHTELRRAAANIRP